MGRTRLGSNEHGIRLPVIQNCYLSALVPLVNEGGFGIRMALIDLRASFLL